MLAWKLHATNGNAAMVTPMQSSQMTHLIGAAGDLTVVIIVPFLQAPLSPEAVHRADPRAHRKHTTGSGPVVRKLRGRWGRTIVMACHRTW